MSFDVVDIYEFGYLVGSDVNGRFGYEGINGR